MRKIDRFCPNNNGLCSDGSVEVMNKLSMITELSHGDLPAFQEQDVPVPVPKCT